MGRGLADSEIQHSEYAVVGMSEWRLSLPSREAVLVEGQVSRVPTSGSSRSDGLRRHPLFSEGGAWTTVDGESMYVRWREVAHSDWSLAIFVPVEGIFASHVLGIAITLLTTIMVLIYIIARGRAVHNSISLLNYPILTEATPSLRFIASSLMRPSPMRSRATGGSAPRCL